VNRANVKKKRKPTVRGRASVVRSQEEGGERLNSSNKHTERGKESKGVAWGRTALGEKRITSL